MMLLLENVLVAIAAVLHIGFLLLEMILWNRPTGRRVFGLSKEFAKQSAALAANQGLYNGFLAAGLIWSFFTNTFSFEIRVFFLGCMITAGIFGALTVNGKILAIQALPAVIALAFVLINQA